MMTATRKPKPRRTEVRATYRFAPDVKNGITKTSETANRSENLQAEYLIKLGLLAVAGIDTTKLTIGQITDKFDELYGDSEAGSI